MYINPWEIYKFDIDLCFSDQLSGDVPQIEVDRQLSPIPEENEEVVSLQNIQSNVIINKLGFIDSKNVSHLSCVLS